MHIPPYNMVNHGPHISNSLLNTDLHYLTLNPDRPYNAQDQHNS